MHLVLFEVSHLEIKTHNHYDHLKGKQHNLILLDQSHLLSPQSIHKHSMLTYVSIEYLWFAVSQRSKFPTHDPEFNRILLMIFIEF